MADQPRFRGAAQRSGAGRGTAPRFIGIDDGPFSFEDERVLVLGVVTRGPQYVEAVLGADAAVDGDDATDAVASMVGGSRYAERVACVFLSGIAVGGFNVLRVDDLARRLAVPVVSLTRDRPDFEAMRAALRGHVRDGEARARLLDESRVEPLRNGDYTLWGTFAGCSHGEAERFAAQATAVGALPEPLRLAHVIASGVVRGESRGKA